ncbi:MAG: DEAD/DEAH box helicase [Saprospiraceae bacterium]
MFIDYFEQYFPENILRQGMLFYESNLVLSLEEFYETSWDWHAQVGRAGTYFKVIVRLEDDGEIISYQCNCKNARIGSGCEHIVAVLYKIREVIDDEGDEYYEVEPIVPSLPRPAEQMLQDYAKLDETAKRLIKIMAVAWEGVSQTRLTHVFNESGFRHEGRQLTPQTIKPLLNQLCKQDWLSLNEDNQYLCHRAFADLLCDRYFASDADFQSMISPIRRNFSQNAGWYGFFEPERVFRDMRIARYQEQPEPFKKHFRELINSGMPQYTPQILTNYWLGEDFNRDKIAGFSWGIQAFFLNLQLNDANFFLSPADTPFNRYARENLSHFPAQDGFLLAFQLAILDLFCGNWPELDKITPYLDTLAIESLRGIRELLRGDHEAAIKLLDQAQKHLRKTSGRNTELLSGLPGIFYLLALLKSQDTRWYRKIHSHVKTLNKYYHAYGPVYSFLDAVVFFLENEKRQAEALLDFESEIPLYSFFQGLCQFWVDRKKLDVRMMVNLCQQASANGYHWIASEIRAVLAEVGDESVEGPMPEGVPLTHLLPYIEEWENALKALAEISGKVQSHDQVTDRIAWLVNFEKNQIQARHQTYGKSGWTKGRKVAFDRLQRRDVPGLTPQDERFITAVTYAWGSEIDLRRKEEAWKHLVDHPLLFLEKSPATAVQLVAAKPSLIATKTDKGYQLRFSQDVLKTGTQVIKESPTRYLFIEVSEQMMQIAQAFNGRALNVPEKAESQLQEILGGLSKLIDVQSAFENENLPAVPADSTIWVHLLPIGDGFHVELYVKPFREVPPYVKPGEGESFLIGHLEGKRIATTRNLKTEEKNSKALRQAVPVLKDRKPNGQIWQLEDGETCLQLLLELQPLLDKGTIRLEWPKGEKFRIDSIVGFDQFRLSVRDGSQWFELEGEIRVDEEKVLSLQELLMLSEQQSHFVEVSPGKFLAFTEAFREKLKSINGLLSSPKKGGALQLHPLASPAIEAFTSALDHLEVSPKFAAHRQHIQKVFEKKFRLAPSFNATLRPYQKDGFQWLHRCAAWGVGACLADDMGLGKTVQALAFLTDRTKLGPALVVAPASVCRNWIAETERFAPGLQPVLFGEGDRETTIKKAGKGTLLIVTYDLMSREEQLFTEKRWATVILDEAQAIKNRATKRSETAMALQTDFRMAMTGTPIENHLGELWNLFQFLNPGLLGSIEQFNERFAIPIEKYKDDNKREQLRRLVQPFILRRRKDEVLKDLPEKTEITLSVELSDKERAFYEALRRNALEKLSETEGGQAGQQHLRILAEIMRLRRAACHPSLVDNTAGFKESAKLSLFAEVLEELLNGGHKALVFSQFVDHLKILEKYLKQQKISYQYLDGSTPGKKRQAAIDAFQAGEGEVFLISLKAGGTGLNLTAADYVIHTDPWWNPAVEDQATDRAHRIGQNRPVTVYRLIAEQTIEEKILRLHAQKRDLADSLLAGTDVSAKLTAEDLMQLLKES